MLRQFIVVACGLLMLQAHVAVAGDVCSVSQAQKIGDFWVSDASDGSDNIWATTPYPRSADWKNTQSKLRQTFDDSARQAIAKFAYPNAPEVSFTLTGLQTLVKNCPQGRWVIYQQPRAGIREARVATEGQRSSSGMRADELFDTTKSFSPEKLLSPSNAN
jgi:hypothetical protein